MIKSPRLCQAPPIPTPTPRSRPAKGTAYSSEFFPRPHTLNAVKQGLPGCSVTSVSPSRTFSRGLVTTDLTPHVNGERSRLTHDHTTTHSPLPSTLSPSQIPIFLDHSSVFSQWYPSTFTVDNERYNCAEQYMMSEQAKLFGDTAIRRKIMPFPNPAQQNRLGRSVSTFNQKRWVQNRYDIVFQGQPRQGFGSPLPRTTRRHRRQVTLRSKSLRPHLGNRL